MGLEVNGVYSQADIEANMMGVDFYNKVDAAAKGGNDFIFDIKEYNAALLNEHKTKNTYSKEVQIQVDKNVEKYETK